MRKVNSFLIIVLLAMIGLAFYPVSDAVNSRIDDPSYEIAKHKFYDEYRAYKINLDNGIRTTPPVDPSGNFRIDDNGNFNMINGEVQDRIINPLVSPDVLSAYTFTQSTTTYTSINTTGTLVAGSTNCDDGGYGPFPIGFTFTYNGGAQTQFGVGCNGYMQFGAVAPALGYNAMSTATNVICPGSQDCQLNTDGAMYYATTGVSPNRICTIEWYHQGFWPTSGNEWSYEVKLFETTNAVQIIYNTGSHTSNQTVQEGMNSNPNTDFAGRTTTTNWAATTASGANTATCTFSPTVFPAAGLTFQWAPPAPPATPVQVRPVYGSVGRPQVDTIQWNPSAGATFYNLQFATDTTFGTLLYSDTTLTGTAYTFGVFSPLTTYWWRVRAKNAIGWSAYSPGWKFKIMGPATTPTLLLPVNNAVNQAVTLTCRWSKAVDQTNKPTYGQLHIINPGQHDNITAVSNYWYELYSDTTAAPTVRDSTLTDTSRTVTGLTNNQNYWWRVKAKNNVGWGAFSSYFKFTTIVLPPPTAPTLISPPNNATGIGLTPTMIWSTVATATSYQLQVSNDPNFATTVLDSVNNTDTLTIPAGRLVNGTTYYWRARGINVGGNGPLSSIFVFTVSPVGIVNNGVIPKVFKLYNAFPNPFNPSSTIKFDIPKPDMVKMVIYNMLGQEVFTLVNSHLEAGSYSITWEASNFPSDVYFYKITAGNFTDIRKIVLVK